MKMPEDIEFHYFKNIFRLKNCKLIVKYRHFTDKEAKWQKKQKLIRLLTI